MAIRDCQNECAFNFPGNVNEDLADMMYFSSVYVCCRLKLIVLAACFKSSFSVHFDDDNDDDDDYIDVSASASASQSFIFMLLV